MTLVSVYVVSRSNETTPVPSNELLSAPYATYLKLVLDTESIEDVTKRVSADGDVSFNGPASRETHIFSFYEKRSLHKALIFENNRSDIIFDAGGYVVDHFSSKGAETVIKLLLRTSSSVLARMAS